MSLEYPRSLLRGLWILTLHLPLIGYGIWLFSWLQPAQGIAQLPGKHLLALLVLLLLPYLLLPRIVPGWNPGRARLGERD